MELNEIYKQLINNDSKLYGELILHPKSNIIEWFYDGLVNPNIFNDNQLFDIYEMDYEIIDELINDLNIDNIIYNEPLINDNTIAFDIHFEL